MTGRQHLFGVRRGRRRPARAGAGLLAVAALLAGCSIGPSTRPPLATSDASGPGPVPQSTVSTMPTGPGGPGRTAGPISWGECPAAIARTDPASGQSFTVQCAQVEVPKSHSTAASGSLAIAVAKATDGRTPDRAPPLVIVLDGPGEAGTHSIARVAGGLPAELMAHFSIVVMDVRGTGESVPIDCVSGQNSDDLLSLGPDPATPAAARLLADLSRSLTFDCGDMVGPDLSDYSTVLAADDIDTIRAAIGVSKIDFLGRGFGATLGAVYADRYPGRVRAAVLDGPADPSLTPDKQAAAIAAASEKALLAFGAACQTFTGGCPLGSDPADAVKKLVGKLGDVSAASGENIVSGGSVLLAVLGQLGKPRAWPGLATALASAQNEDYDPIVDLLRSQFGADEIERLQSGRLVFQCNDSGQRLGGAALTTAARSARSAAPVFGPFLLGLVGVCSSWPAPETPLGRVSAFGAPPLLVLGAVDDPVAPYSEVRSLTAVLDSATLLTWQSGTHGSYRSSACVTAAVNGYLLNAAVPAAGTLCPP